MLCALGARSGAQRAVRCQTPVQVYPSIALFRDSAVAGLAGNPSKPDAAQRSRVVMSARPLRAMIPQFTSAQLPRFWTPLKPSMSGIAKSSKMTSRLKMLCQFDVFARLGTWQTKCWDRVRTARSGLLRRDGAPQLRRRHRRQRRPQSPVSFEMSFPCNGVRLAKVLAHAEKHKT
jgi:hypothetical protein